MTPAETIAKLRREILRGESSGLGAFDAVVQMKEAAERQVETLRKALEPFGHAAKHIAFYVPEALPSEFEMAFPKSGVHVDPDGPGPFRLTYPDFNRAAAALAAVEQDGGRKLHDATATALQIAGDLDAATERKLPRQLLLRLAQDISAAIRATDDTPPPAQLEPDGTAVLRTALDQARQWIVRAAHDDGCFTNDPNPDAGSCICGRDSILRYLDDVLEPDGAEVGSAIADIAAERRRQIEGEGWTRIYDDTHTDRSLARAAASYCESAARPKVVGWSELLVEPSADNDMPRQWPWSRNWWKPKSPRRDLVRAGALIVAEIERLDRLPAPPSEHGEG